MFRTTRQTSLLVGALTVLAGIRPTAARPADSPPREPHSIVAQSTQATAGTGRRPISQRIVASNLPLRAPAPPDCAQDACHDAAIDVEVVDTTVDVEADSPDTPLVVDASAPAEADAQVVADLAAEAEPMTTFAQADSPAPRQFTHPVPLPAEMTAPIEQAESARIDLAAEATPLVESPAALVMPVAAPAQPAPTQTVRETLLKRIKGALGSRSRDPVPPAAGREAAVVVAAPTHPGGDTHPAPRPIALQPDSSPAAAPGQPTLADAAHAGSTTDPAAVEDAVGAVPARLEFDVRESRSLVGEGEQIVMRIAVRNVGGETAERVTATLFFAEGIEPVQAIGQSAEVYPGEVRFESVPQLSPGSSVDLLVTAVGTRPGSVTYRGELECRQLAGRIAREGAVTVRAKRAAQP